MNNIIPFTYESQQVRVIKDDAGNPWWVAKDVCDVLNYSDVSMTMQILDDDEKLIQVFLVSGQNRDLWTVSEPGLYTLIVRSNKPEAKKFKRWITHVVLPAIRKNGHYVLPADEDDPAELILKKHFGIRIKKNKSGTYIITASA